MKTDNEPCPQDCGYSWVVLFACVVANFFFTSGASLIGVIQVELINLYPEDTVMITWTSGLYMAMAWFTSVPASLLITYFGCRTVGVVASLIISAGLIAAYLTSGPLSWIIFIGAIIGPTTGVYFPLASMGVQKYFTEKRTLAQGVIMAALSLGFLAYPPLVQFLIDQYSWRGAVLIHAGLNLHVIPACLLMKEVRATKDKSAHLNQTDCEEISYEVQDVAQENRGNSESNLKVLFKTDGHTNESKTDDEQLQQKTLILAAFKEHPVISFAIVACCLSQWGNIMILMLTPLMADHLGIDRMKGALLISVAGLIGLVLRPIMGFIGDRKNIDAGYMCGISCLAAGGFTALISLVNSYGLLAALAALNSVPSAAFMATILNLLGTLVDPKHAAVAIGCGCTGFGIGQLLGLGSTGFLLKLTGSPRMTFLLGGCAQMLAGFIFLGVLFTQGRNRKLTHNRK